jgi:hypothetical protein
VESARREKAGGESAIAWMIRRVVLPIGIGANRSMRRLSEFFLTEGYICVDSETIGIYFVNLETL